MDPQPIQPPQKNNGLAELKKDYLRTMQKDIASMETKRAETERAQILQKGFVAPQQTTPGQEPTSQPKRPAPPPSPPRPPILQPPIKPPQQTFQPPQPQTSEAGLPKIQSPPPIPPRPVPPPPSPLRPLSLQPQKPPLAPSITSQIKRVERGAPVDPQTTKEAISKFVLPPKKKSGLFIKILPIIVIILLLGGGASGYWFVIRKGVVKLPCLPVICKKPPLPPPAQPPAPPAPPTPPPPQPPPAQPVPPTPPPTQTPTPPVSIIRVDKQVVYEIKELNDVKSTTSQILKQKESLHSLESIDFSIEAERFLSLAQTSQALGLSLPAGLLETLEPSYTFFRFTQKENGRLGFVAKVKDVALARQQATIWEKTMAQDSQQFFSLLGKQANKGPFKQASWRGVSFRYYDFIPEKLGIVYAIHPTQNLFIFTSSGESMIDIINRIELK